MPNRLARETSPYLLQHKDNPVDWYPWGEEALARARAENKPILLSVGYSACHWCHVMEHESFENAETARIMNENFINIKVDREERPDLDHIYQNVAQAMTGGGGWPLTVFLTPDLSPFYGGTYFPPEDKFGRPGFSRVLHALAEAFRKEPESIKQNSERLVEMIRRSDAVESTSKARPTFPELSDLADKLLRSYMDWDHGGFGSAPKFPNSMLLDFLWRVALASDHEQAREGVLLSLRKMARGGLYDHLGGGFHRYSVDERWAVPHFEKMLYDNALLLRLYSQVSLSGKAGADQAEFDRVIEETVEYLLREMQSPEGGFYSTQDADSEGEEGKFFVWDPEDLARELNVNEAKAFALRYDVSPSGNFEHSKTVLAISRELSEIAQTVSRSEEEVVGFLSSARRKLFSAREKRIKPGRDEKVLVSWNGLMISGLLWVAEALRLRPGKEDLAEKAQKAAENAFDFIEKKMMSEGFKLSSVWKDGQARFNAYLDDYAFMASAALDLARFSDDEESSARALDFAAGWVGEVQSRFSDPSAPGYFFTSNDHESLIHRPKTVLDQAIPAGTSVVIGVLSALSEIDWKEKGASWDQELERQLTGVFASSVKNPFGMGEFLCAAALDALGPVVVSGSGRLPISAHPHVFRRPRAKAHPEGRWLVCHQRTCSAPLGADQASSEIARKLLL